MAKKIKRYYAVKVFTEVSGRSTLFHAAIDGELYLSAKGRVCGMNAMAHLETPELAMRLIKYKKSRKGSRFGASAEYEVVEYEVVEWEEVEEERLLSRIEADSHVVAQYALLIAAND